MLLDEGGGEIHQTGFVTHRKKGQFLHKRGALCGRVKAEASPQ
jgi:hypothetical protein